MPMRERNGLIVILDALGASNYSKDEIEKFMDSRKRVLSLLNGKIERILGEVDSKRVDTFTFNDTIIIAYEPKGPICTDDILAFCYLLRHFEVKSMEVGILFRGAMSIGLYYSDNETNTIMGRAITDAASWYDKSEWIGIAATPQATLLIRSFEKQSGDNIQHVIIDYEVPMRDIGTLSLRAVNWPKGFYVKGLRPLKPGEDEKAKCLQLLALSGIPRGTETKYFNSVKFYDHCITEYKKARAALKAKKKLKETQKMPHK